VGIPEALHFGTEGLIPFLSNGEVDHWHEGFSGEEGICLLAGEDSSGVGVLSCAEGARVAGAVVSPRKEELWVVGDEVVPIERGVDRPPSQSWDSVVVLWGYPLDISMPVVPGYNPEFLDDFRSGCAWAVVEVQRWRPWVWFVQRGSSRRSEEVEFLNRYLGVSDNEQLVDVGRG
jgi:hypothetical protein